MKFSEFVCKWGCARWGHLFQIFTDTCWRGDFSKDMYIYINFFFLFQINKVITGVSYFTHRHTVAEEEEWLTAERMAVSIKHIILAYLHKNKLCIPGTDFKELLYNTDTYTFNKIQMVNKQF